MTDEPSPPRVILPKPTSARQARNVVTAALAITAVVAVGVISFVVAGGTDDDTDRSPAAAADDGASSTEVGAGTDEDLVEVAVEADQQTLRFLLPGGWVDSAPGAGAGGSQIFPNDRNLAEIFDSNVQVATEQGAILFALNTDVEHPSSVRVFLNTPAQDLDTAVDSGRQILLDSNIVPSVDEPLALAASTGHIFRYQVAVGTTTLDNFQIIVPSPNGLYVLVAQSDDPTVIDELVNLAPSIEIT